MEDTLRCGFIRGVPIAAFRFAEQDFLNLWLCKGAPHNNMVSVGRAVCASLDDMASVSLGVCASLLVGTSSISGCSRVRCSTTEND